MFLVRPKQLPPFMRWVASVAIAVVVIVVVRTQQKSTQPAELVAENSINELFADQFPVAKVYRDELKLMRYQGKLTQAHEEKVSRSIFQATEHIDIPESVLWCLFFQESRLNNLLGLDGKHPSHGLGQFTRFGFYEVNNQTRRYSKESLKYLTTILGEDVRPIQAMKNNIHHPSSYYNIPTAVTASAIYLNNRYHHLARLLQKRDIAYDKDVLWLHATMAYNKGTRGVLSVWNRIRRTKGQKGLEQTLTNDGKLRASLASPGLVSSALRRIWSQKRAQAYGKELQTHLESIHACAVDIQKEGSR